MPEIVLFLEEKFNLPSTECDDIGQEFFTKMIEGGYKQCQRDPQTYIRTMAYKIYKERQQCPQTVAWRPEYDDLLTVEFEYTDEYGELQPVIDALRESEKDLLDLIVVKDCSQGQSASVLNIAECAVKQRYYRVKNKLRLILATTNKVNLDMIPKVFRDLILLEKEKYKEMNDK